MAITAIEKLQRHADRIRTGKAKIHPGQPMRLSEAAAPGDGIWQGDLGLEVVESVPADYELAAAVTLQLVPGTTQGSRHCLDSSDGVTMYLPSGWGQNYDGLQGPCMVLTKERTIVHPTHGAVTIPAGFTIACRYQREWDAEQRKERRNQD
jgi:hypothetical protein